MKKLRISQKHLRLSAKNLENCSILQSQFEEEILLQGGRWGRHDRNFIQKGSKNSRLSGKQLKISQKHPCLSAKKVEKCSTSYSRFVKKIDFRVWEGAFSSYFIKYNPLSKPWNPSLQLISLLFSKIVRKFSF